jgi:hypothetical protein
MPAAAKYAAAKYFVINIISLVAFIVIVWEGAHFVAALWPSLGDVLGILGTLALFAPTASDIVWGYLQSKSEPAIGPGGEQLPKYLNYVAFSWKRVFLNALGITLIGIGFGVNYLTKGS